MQQLLLVFSENAAKRGSVCLYVLLVHRAAHKEAAERDPCAKAVGDAAVVLLHRHRRSRDVDDDLLRSRSSGSSEDEAMLAKPLGRAHRRRGDRLRDRGGDRGFGGGHGERVVCAPPHEG